MNMSFSTANLAVVAYALANATVPVDTDFAIVILRSTIPTPTDSNGDQDGPV